MDPATLLWIEAAISVVLAIAVVFLQRTNTKLVIKVLELQRENVQLRKGKPNAGELGGVQEDVPTPRDD